MLLLGHARFTTAVSLHSRGAVALQKPQVRGQSLAGEPQRETQGGETQGAGDEHARQLEAHAGMGHAPVQRTATH